MKTITILVNSLESGGAEKQSVYLVNALKDSYRTYLVVLHGTLIDEKIIQLIDGSNYTLLKLEGNWGKRLLNLYKHLKRNKVTHLFTYLTKPNFFGATVGLLAGVGSVYGGIRTTKFPFLKRILERFVMNHLTTKTIFNSYLGESLLGGKEKSRMIVIPNCFPKVKQIKSRPKKEIVKIITVGRFDEAKDYRTAILSIKELMKSCPNFVYQIVGYGKLEKQIREWIVENDLSRNVVLCINPDNVSALLDESDIYLTTSAYEGTSNSIMEALNASLPIVATNVGDNNRLVHEGRSGFLHDVGDYKNIANSLLFLTKNYESRVKFGIVSHEILQKNYSYEKFKNSYIELIELK